jgi:hypothetical protein
MGDMLTMNSLGDGSTLSLDFTTGVLDHRLTFSRTSNATFINSSGYVEWSASNHAPRTNWNFTSPTSSGWNAATVSGTGTFQWVGNETVIAASGSAGQSFTNITSPTGISEGLRYVMSVTALSVTGSPTIQSIFDVTSASENTYFKNGAAATSGTTVASGDRISVSAIASSATMNVRIGCGAWFSNRTNESVTLTKFHWHPGSVPVSYYENTGTSPRYDSARFDYSPTNIGEPKGLLIEGSAINYMLYSTALDPHNLRRMRAISTASIIDPEGTTNKARIVAADGTAGYHGRYLATTAGTNTTVTISIFAKKNGYKYLNLSDVTINTASVQFDLDDGSTSNSLGSGFVSASATAYPNGWWRCSMIVTVTASTSYSWLYVGVPTTGVVYSAGFGVFYTGENLDDKGIYCYGFQVEGGAGASSYIPTAASQVTRAVDTAIIAAGTNFSSWYTGGTTGTFVTEWCRCSPTTTQRTVIATSDVSNQHLHQYIAATTSRLRLADKVPAFIETANASIDNSINKGAFSYAGSVQSLCLNGGTVVPGTLTFTTAPTWLSIGGPSTNGTSITDTAVVLNNAIRKIKYFPTRLSDAKIKEITT